MIPKPNVTSWVIPPEDDGQPFALTMPSVTEDVAQQMLTNLIRCREALKAGTSCDGVDCPQGPEDKG